MFKKNDRVKLIGPINELQKVGEIFKIVNIVGHIIVIVSEKTGKRNAFSDVVISTYFEKVEYQDDETVKSVPYEKIEKLMAEANVKVITFFDKTTVVAAQFPNGFVITESSSCVDPRAYDEDTGRQICLKRIKNRLLEMEGYSIQEQNYITDKVNGTMKNVIKSASLKNPKKEITDDLVTKVYKEIMGNVNKLGVYSEEMIESKIADISERENVDYEELHNRVIVLITEEIHNLLFRCLIDLY